MIYAVPIENYPNKSQCIEEVVYADENMQEWRIARIQNGFMVRYFGEPYFIENKFYCELTSGRTITVKNTNCLFFQSSDLDTFCEVRDILKNGFTDEIWETFETLFAARFEEDLGMLKSEM